MTTELHQPLGGLLDGGAHARADLVRSDLSDDDIVVIDGVQVTSRLRRRASSRRPAPSATG